MGRLTGILIGFAIFGIVGIIGYIQEVNEEAKTLSHFVDLYGKDILDFSKKFSYDEKSDTLIESFKIVGFIVIEDGQLNMAIQDSFIEEAGIINKDTNQLQVVIALNDNRVYAFDYRERNGGCTASVYYHVLNVDFVHVRSKKVFKREVIEGPYPPSNWIQKGCQDVEMSKVSNQAIYKELLRIVDESYRLPDKKPTKKKKHKTTTQN